MDIVGGVKLADGSEARIVSGVDDHSRFCVSAQVVARATARPTCDALGLAMHGAGACVSADRGGSSVRVEGAAGSGPAIDDAHDVAHSATHDACGCVPYAPTQAFGSAPASSCRQRTMPAAFHHDTLADLRPGHAIPQRNTAPRSPLPNASSNTTSVRASRRRSFT